MKKGFTLIELLAVIVILAIIALIATPIILNIINDSKVEANKRSADNYLDAVELAIARENLNSEFNPSACIIEENKNLLCDGDKTLTVKVDGSSPSSGYITFKNGKVKSYSLTIDEETMENTVENPFIVDAFYSSYGNLGTPPMRPTIDSNNIDISVGTGNSFRINFPDGGYSFDWTISGGGDVYFYSESGDKDKIVSHLGSLTNTEKYVTSEPGYIIFNSTGCAFSIKNLKYNNMPVTINYTYPTASIKQVSTGCQLISSSSVTPHYICESNIENGGSASEPIYIFVDGPIYASIKINDDEWTNMNVYYSRRSYFKLTDPGTYKIKVAYGVAAGSGVSTGDVTFWPSEEEFTVTITE